MPAESKLRAYIQKTREIIASDDFTLGLTEDQKRQVIDGFKKRIAELSAAESDAFKQEAENILAADEYEKAQRGRENARGASDGATVLNALVRGGVSLPTNAAALTAQAADMAGLKDTAMLLDQYAKDTDYDAEQMFPRAAEGSGYPIRILEAAGENAPAMLATGFGTKALLSGVGRLGVTSNRAAKTLEVLGTAAGMSVPELRKDAVQTNRYGSVMPLENPSAVLVGAIPHALIETGMGVTPLGLVGGADKAGLFKKGFSELLARYQRRYGNRAASRLLLDRLMTETPLGEGMEEVLQNPVGAFTRNLANNDLSTAIQKTGDEITKPGYLGQLGEEFIIGTGVGAVYSGAKALIDKKIEDPKTPVTEKQQLAMTKERLQIENQARLQLPYTGDASTVLPDGSPITDIQGMAARDPRSRNIVSILPDGTPVYDDVDPRLTSPAIVSPTALPQPSAPGLLPPPPSAVELGNMFLRAHARGDQSGSLALRDYAESRSNTAPRAKVEPLKGGGYDRMTVRVDGVQIPTENRALLRGNSEAAARLEKKLPQQQPDVTLPQKSESGDQADKKQWYIDADDMPVYTVKSDATGYRGPYSKQEIKDLTEVDPSTLTEKNYGKEATLARRERAVTKNGYKVESYQGGFRVLDPEGKQYSWHTSKQAADSKATNLNSGKTAPVVAPKAEPKAETKPVDPQQTTRITSENAEALANAQRLRKSAASLLEQAQADLNRDRQTNTARRARMAAGATDDAANREAFAKTMNNLADAMERGEVRYLKNVKSRPDLILFKNELTQALGRHARKNDKPYDWYKKEPVTDAAIRDGAEFNRPHPYGDWFDHAAKELEAIHGMKPAAAYIEKLGRGNRSRNVSLSDDAIGRILDIKKTIAKKGIKTPYQFARILETVEDYQKLKAAGIKSDSDLADALIEYRNLEAGKKQESPLVKAERELIGKKFEGFDFFPTPPALAERMAQELDIKPGMKVLEPSAGKGDLADAVKAAQPEADVKVIEPLSDLREILTMKNHEVVDTNFENFETDQRFDRIIMNPPFSKNRDIRHVRKAYELLAPGGKMIAIMGNHSAFANDKESVEFREWLGAVGGTSESLGQVFAGKDAFRQTGVNSQLVTIEKPAGAGAKTTSNRKHSYSNTDVAVPKIVANKMLDLGKAIPVREIYTDKDDPSYGLETRPHITVRYGLSTDNPADLRKLSDLPPITVEMGEVSIFETDKYDVVKVDIESEGLRAANKKVGELVEVPGETYKDYKPHATIAYVKKGEGKKYIGNKSLLGQTFEIDEINLVDRDGEEHPIKLTGKPVETRVRTTPDKTELSGQTVETPPAASDLVKPEEKDFESATDYLKALTVWREKTGNLTAAEVKRRDRALRFADRAAKTGQKASGLFRQADKISERFYMGQPILVGHHSERGARAAQNRMHNKMDAALKEEKKAEYYSQRAESAEKNKSISSADEDAIVKLKAKLESLSKVQERMKQANKVVKASKLSDAEKITKLQEQGFSEAKAKNLLEKDFAGRVGFPAYALQNNNAEMSRLKKRIEELSVKQSQRTQKIEFDGGEIVDNVAENRLQIFFDSKPDEATREKLKSNGFRWAPSAGAWQMHRSTWANRKAESITGAKIPAAQPAQAETAEQPEVKSESVKEPLYSAEYLVARYAKRGLSKAGQVVKRGLKLIRQAGVTFAKWARQMVNDFGQTIRKHLRNLWADLGNFNKRLGRTGAISGRPAGLKNDEPGQTSPAPNRSTDKPPTEPKQMATSRGLVWKRVDKDTYELELTDPNTGKTSVVETIRRPKGSDNIWNVDNWTTFDNKGTGSGSFTSLKVAKAAIKAHARDAFNQRIYRENGVVKDRQRDEALKKKRERGLERDKERDAREAAQQKNRKKKAEEFIAKGKKKKTPEAAKPKTWRDHARSFVAKVEEVLFDAWAPVRRLQETIKKAAGVSELPESLDLYQKLEVVAGKVEAGTRIFKDKYFKQIKDYLVENNINYNEANRFLAIMHAKERNDAIAERNPAFALTGAPGSGIETEQARKEIAEHKKNGTYEKLLKFAEMTYRLNNALLDEQVRYGLLSQKQRDAYRRYKHYTPMKSPPDQGFVLDRTAFGRRSEATDQLAYIEKAIDVVYKRGERKHVINTALNLFSKYSNPKLYREYEPDQVQYYDKRTGKVRLRADTSKLYNNPAVIWSRDVNSGELKAFEIKDTGLQNALNRQYSDLGVEQKAFRYFAGVNRFLAGVSTAYNPEFIFTNLLRDVQQGAASVGVNLPEGSVKKFVENLGRAKKAISDARAGKVTADTRLLEEFQLAGGKTGYSELSRLEDTARNLEREISEAQTGGRWYDTKQSLIKVKDWIADWNDAIETRTRFAGYLTAKEAGFSTQKSAAFAKGMTINFNKKGTWAPVFNSLYLFSSASLGGSFVTANIIGKAAKTPKGRAMIAGAIVLGFVMELLNRAVAGDDDDEGVNYYDKVPDYIKDSNYVVMIPGTKGKYFAIPMPYGLNVLPSIGRNMAASMFGVQSFKAGAANVVGAVLNSFNPIGGDNRGFGYQLVPTAARPFIDIATNSSWTGRKIRPDQPAFGAKVARSELYFDQESKVLVKATKLLNELTGGDRYTDGFASFLSPAEVGHLLESYTGGVGRTLSRSADTVTRVVTGEAPELDNVPVVRRFGGEATDYNTWQTFKENSEIVEDFERARRERNIEYLKSNRQLLPAVALYKNTGKRITMIRKKASLSEPEKQKMILSAQKSFNKKFREIRDKALSKN